MQTNVHVFDNFFFFQDIVDKSQVLKIQVLSVDDSKHIKGGDDPSQTVFKERIITTVFKPK